MCGICGASGPEALSAVGRMNSAMAHRGPDDEGVHADEGGGMVLGARRLSIIDVAGGHQPLSNEDGTIWAALNGEIYNHPSLRRDLLDRGHRLSTRTDTEVLVHLYEDHGDALVHALEGMFAFAIWDQTRRRLLIGRDRFGEKPLFYRERAGKLSFASELTALLAADSVGPDLDPAAVHAYFILGYVPGPAALVRDVAQLPPASILTWEAEAPRARISRYWATPQEVSAARVALEEIVEEAEGLLRRAVRGRMLSDVPLGVFLSGGVDSTLVAAIAAQESGNRLQTFSVGYDVGQVSETDRAREVAQQIGAEHHELRLTVDQVQRRVPRLLAGLDQPLADPALVASHALAEFARRDVTVAVGGEGADELFGGYPRYRWLARAQQLNERLPVGVAALASSAVRRGVPGRAKRLADVLEPKTSLERHIDWVTEGRRHLAGGLYGPLLAEQAAGGGVPPLIADRLGSGDGSIAARFLRLDQAQWLPDDVLAKADRASMLASLELRTPFLHRELAELAALVPPRVHVARPGKIILRRLLRERLGLSPPRGKTAFSVPLADWLRGPLAGLLDEQVRSGSLVSEGWFDGGALSRLVENHRRGDDRSSMLWPMLALGVWLDRQRASGPK